MLKVLLSACARSAGVMFWLCALTVVRRCSYEIFDFFPDQAVARRACALLVSSLRDSILGAVFERALPAGLSVQILVPDSKLGQT